MKTTSRLEAANRLEAIAIALEAGPRLQAIVFQKALLHQGSKVARSLMKTRRGTKTSPQRRAPERRSTTDRERKKDERAQVDGQRLACGVVESGGGVHIYPSSPV